MKCEDINLIEFIEGAAPGEIKTHINKCTKCREDSERLSEFFNNVLPIYKAGKEINEKIERELKAMDVVDMVPLPRELAQKVAYLRNRRLTEKLKKEKLDGANATLGNLQGELKGILNAMTATEQSAAKESVQKVLDQFGIS